MTPEQFRFLYAILGLIVGAGSIVLGVLLFVRRIISRHCYTVKIGPFEINASAPGLGFAFFGVIVIWLTKL